MRSPAIIFTLISLLLLSQITLAQKEGNNWYFGLGAGLSFNTVPPQALTDGQSYSDEGTASISDFNGNLLFYTDGMTVYDRLHQVMPNGTGLLGNTSSTTSAMIVPKPGVAGIFYIFTADADENNFMNGYRYSEVDMSLHGGLGDLNAIKNVRLGTARSTERIAAFPHENGEDVWIVTKEYGNNRFNVYRAGCAGVNPIPVVSDIGIIHDESIFLSGQGQMKVSPDGKKLAVAINSINIIQLFDFNSATGQITNPININVFPQNLLGLYGTEFSPNSRVLYAGHRADRTIYQFDISSNVEMTINASSVVIPSITTPSSFQIGPDKKIYIANLFTQHVSVIENPDNYGVGFNFIEGAVSLNGRGCRAGLPNYLTRYYDPVSWNADFTSSFVDCRVEFSGSSSHSGPVDWIWDFGDGTTGTGQIIQHSYQNQGNYTVKLKAYRVTSCGSRFDSTEATHTVTINNVFHIDFSNSGSCTGTTLQFTDQTVLNAGSITGYFWDFGDGNTSILQNPSHIYSTPGTYDIKLVVSTNGVCRADSIIKTIYADSQPLASFPEINGCVNLPFNFTDQSSNAGSAIATWSWDFGGSGGSNIPSPTYTFTTSGTYPVRLTVTTQFGCEDDSLYVVTVEDKPNAAFSNSSFCLGQPVGFIDLSTIGFGSITSWDWDFGDGGSASVQNPSHIYLSEGDFPVSLTVSSQYGCISAPFNVTGVVKAVKANAGNDTTALLNQPHQLLGSGGIKYVWEPSLFLNNPSIATPIAVLSNDQTFALEVETAEGCKGIDYVHITVVKKFDIYVPSAFTPNGDGKNDVLRPYPVGIKELGYFRVYNRYGQQVFATKQVGAGWDGTINGKAQGSEIFVWMLRAVDLNGRTIEKKGTSALIR